MHISVIGAYNKNYSRTNVLLRGLSEAGVSYKEYHVPFSSPIKRCGRLKKLLRQTPITGSAVLIPFPCHHEVPVVRKFTRKPIVFDCLISRYMSKVFDLKAVSRYSIHAWANRRADKRALDAADVVLCDTTAHKDYFINEYRISPQKIQPVYVGYNSDDFYPLPNIVGGTEKTIVGFYGSFLPLHGIDQIIDAATLLKEYRDIHFELIGEGYTFAKIKDAIESRGLRNISLLGKQPYSSLNGYINHWDICLGIFGTTLKSDLVIPNKIYHYAGCKRPFITKDSPAIREVFNSETDGMLCSNTPEAIAQSILRLGKNKDLRDTMAEHAYALVSQGYTHRHIGIHLQKILKNCSAHD